MIKLYKEEMKREDEKGVKDWESEELEINGLISLTLYRWIPYLALGFYVQKIIQTA